MEKKLYNQPVTDVQVLTTAHLMGSPLLGSPTGPEPVLP